MRKEAADLLGHVCKTIPRESLHVPGPDVVDRIFQVSDRGNRVLINSGGPSGKDDFAQAVKTAVINKRAGGTGLISGRKVFQRPRDEGIRLLHEIQDVYLSRDVTVA
jgi:DhnA family fructose-bisphosphate aldolase class Ia